MRRKEKRKYDRIDIDRRREEMKGMEENKIEGWKKLETKMERREERRKRFRETEGRG